MAKFRDVKTLQEFASVHASMHNHFNHDRHLNRRDIFKRNRSAALPEGVHWRHESEVAEQFRDRFATDSTVHGADSR